MEMKKKKSIGIGAIPPKCAFSVVSLLRDIHNLFLSSIRRRPRRHHEYFVVAGVVIIVVDVVVLYADLRLYHSNGLYFRCFRLNLNRSTVFFFYIETAFYTCNQNIRE